MLSSVYLLTEYLGHFFFYSTEGGGGGGGGRSWALQFFFFFFFFFFKLNNPAPLSPTKGKSNLPRSSSPKLTALNIYKGGDFNKIKSIIHHLMTVFSLCFLKLLKLLYSLLFQCHHLPIQVRFMQQRLTCTIFHLSQKQPILCLIFLQLLPTPSQYLMAELHIHVAVTYKFTNMMNLIEFIFKLYPEIKKHKVTYINVKKWWNIKQL